MCRFVVIYSKINKIDNNYIKKYINTLFTSFIVESDDNNPILNVDGFGIGVYKNDKCVTYKNIVPLCCDNNIYNFAELIESQILCIHARADNSEFKNISYYNCHPFVYNNYMFCHNGCFYKFMNANGKKEVINEIDNSLYINIKGTTDSEHFFYIILTYIKNGKLLTDSIIDALNFMKKDNNICIATFFITDGKKKIIVKYSNDEYHADIYMIEDDDLIIFSSKKIKNKQNVLINNKQLIEINENMNKCAYNLVGLGLNDST